MLLYSIAIWILYEKITYSCKPSYLAYSKMGDFNKEHKCQSENYISAWAKILL